MRGAREDLPESLPRELALHPSDSATLHAARAHRVCAKRADGKVSEFKATCRIHTPQKIQYVRHGGILQYVLRKLAGLA